MKIDDYTKAEFPLDLPWGGMTVRLFGAVGDRVVGATIRTLFVDGKDVESIGQALHWDSNGIWESGQHSHMDLPPPPAIVESKIQEMQDQLAAAQDRLDSFPDAPAEWREKDVELIKLLHAKIAHLEGPAQ